MKQLPKLLSSLLLLNLILLLSFYVIPLVAASGENPFTPKAHAIRYWNNKVYKVPHPEFLLKKASPLSASDSARFTQLASLNSLSTHLPSFCKLANLLCFPDPTPSLSSNHSSPDNIFSIYDDYSLQNFTNYATGSSSGGLNSFKNYSENQNVIFNSFRGYSRDSKSHDDKFNNYADGANVPFEKFNTYASGSTGGSGEFSTYENNVNDPGLQFTTYSDKSAKRVNSFNSYTDGSNAGDFGFNNYAKNGKDLTHNFKSYANNVNVVGTNFNAYSIDGDGGNENFTSYANNGNEPVNRFFNYAVRENKGVESFSTYREQHSNGGDVFKSYAKNSNSANIRFGKYAEESPIINIWGPSNFTGYGEGAKGQKIGFMSYGQGKYFKEYAKEGVTFADYRNTTTSESILVGNMKVNSKGKVVNKWVEPGKFFRESMLKEGNVIQMPDIRDKMPKRSFLPRSILSKIPFSSSNITQLRGIFHAFDDSNMERILNSALRECERDPSVGETKRCVGSVEDMIDFAVSVLGRAVEARTTENVSGSKTDILIGKVRGINGGNVTKSVSCHQSLYPYLLYYCHSVPKVRVYEADILDSKTKAKINHGVAICHVDTSAWSATHGAFVALGPGPGKIEVCHWIFENDLTWTIAD